MGTPQDGRLGRMALLRGLVTAEQLKSCLAEQEEGGHRAGSEPSLADLLRRRGLVSDEALRALLAETGAVAPGPPTSAAPTVNTSAPPPAPGAAQDAAPNAAAPAPPVSPESAPTLVAPAGARPRATDPTVRMPTAGDTTRATAVLPDAAGSAAPAAPSSSAVTVCASAAGASTAGPATTPPTPEPAGESFGRYRLLRVLGRGGMGVVYQAWDTDLKRVVALKTLHPEATPGPEEVERFLREARAAARLRHPNVVQLHDVGTHGGRHYFTMDFIEGESLESAKRRLAPRRFLEVLRDVALALHAAHEAGLVHRDVKPANILLDGGTRPYVSDFGLAKEVRGETGRTLTVTGAVIGTPHFMPPEQAAGRADLVGPWSDQWSLGVILYEHLAGRLPYERPTLVQVLRAIAEEEPVAPSRAAAGAPTGGAAAGGATARRGRQVHQDLETICLKCLEKDPRRRYPSCAALAADLGRFLDHEPIEARALGTAARLWRTARHNKAVSIPAATLAAALLVSGAALGIQALVHAAHVRTRRQEAEAALAVQDLAQAGRLVEDLRDLAPADHEVDALYCRYRSELAVQSGDAAFREYQQLTSTLDRMHGMSIFRDNVTKHTRQRAEKEKAWRDEAGVRSDEEMHEVYYARALAAYSEALAWRRDNFSAKDRLGNLYVIKFLDAERRRDLPEMNAYRELVLKLGTPQQEAKLLGVRTVRVTLLLPEELTPGDSAPPIEAFLYRYLPKDMPPIEVPIPCDPATGDAPGTLELGPDEPVSLAVLRSPAGAAAAREARRRTAIELRRDAHNRVALEVKRAGPAPGGRERARLVFSARLPRGSYLLWLPGFGPGSAPGWPPGVGLGPTRYPFEVARDADWDETCELYTPADVPPLPAGMDVPSPPAGERPADGPPARAAAEDPPYWVYLPAGPLYASGDPHAEQHPVWDAQRMWVGGPDGRGVKYQDRPAEPPTAGVFLARFEATSAMYLAYLNDRTWHPAAAAFRRTPRTAKEPTEKTAFWKPDAQGVFRPSEQDLPGDLPALGISWNDAMDYVKWLTARQGGGRWEFRLPTEEEWERAARAPDGRFFPWGDHFDVSFCHMGDSRRSDREDGRPERIGLFPLDESPFGIRDLAGGQSEWTATLSRTRSEWPLTKGGNWFVQPPMCHAACREGHAADDLGMNVGFRLCACRIR